MFTLEQRVFSCLVHIRRVVDGRRAEKRSSPSSPNLLRERESLILTNLGLRYLYRKKLEYFLWECGGWSKYFSLLDNAPNYLDGYNIQKRSHDINLIFFHADSIAGPQTPPKTGYITRLAHNLRNVTFFFPTSTAGHSNSRRDFDLNKFWCIYTYVHIWQ